MADIEAKLLQKEESLWRRGQVEIRKLQLEQQAVTSCIGKMQEKQAALMTENQKIRGVLLEVTTKFELVVKEMREVLRALPPRATGEQRLSPSPSVASTSASEVVREENSFEQPSFEQPSELSSSILTGADPSGVWSIDSARQHLVQQTPPVVCKLPMWHTRGNAEGLTELPCFDAEDTGLGESATFCTPPRATPNSEDVGNTVDQAMVAPPPPASWVGTTGASPGPAVLSLATALPSNSPVPSPSPGLKAQRLHLAEHLEQQVIATPPPHARDIDVPRLKQPEPTPSTAGAHLATPIRQFDFFNIDLIKEDGFMTLGVEVHQLDGASLRIESIDEHGLVGRHNLLQDSDVNRVHVGDRIIEVNGVRHDPVRMLQECRVQQRLAFTLVRGAAGSNTTGKANTSWDTSGQADAIEVQVAPKDDSSSSASAAMSLSRASTAATGTKAGSPLPTRLRPEASVFIPSAKKELSQVVPPGLELYDLPRLLGPDASPAAVAEVPPESGTAAGTSAEVKRTLFH